MIVPHMHTNNKIGNLLNNVNQGNVPEPPPLGEDVSALIALAEELNQPGITAQWLLDVSRVRATQADVDNAATNWYVTFMSIGDIWAQTLLRARSSGVVLLDTEEDLCFEAIEHSIYIALHPVTRLGMTGVEVILASREAGKPLRDIESCSSRMLELMRVPFPHPIDGSTLISNVIQLLGNEKGEVFISKCFSK